MSTTNTASVKRACDACHRRKVRCDGKLRCNNCENSALTCTYNAIPQKKGPKGSRAKVISELRRAQRTPRSYAPDPGQLALINQNHGIVSTTSMPPMQTQHSSFARTPGLLNPQTIDSCLDFFFRNMYPTMPILNRARLQQQLPLLDQSPELYCLICSLCAFMCIQGMQSLGDDNPTSSSTHGRILLDEALRVRKSFDHVETASSHSVMTSFFFFGCYFGLDKHATAWYHLREATTLAQILGMQDESGYMMGDALDMALKRRLFWLLFVTERAYALQRHRPLTLHSTIALPTIEADSPESVELSGFLHLVNLFRPFDDTFVGLWNKSRTDCSTAWLSQLQEQLATALPVYLDSTEVQAADLRTSQQWLRTMVWKLSIQNGFLLPNTTDTSMTLKFPLEIARDLVGVTAQLSRSSMEVHGIGLIEKIFDVASTLTEVMSCMPLAPSTFEFGPRDYLTQCLSLISTLRGGDSRFLPLLLAQIDKDLPALMNAPQTAPQLQWDALGLPPPQAGPVEGRVEELFDSASSTNGSSILDSPEALLLDNFEYPPLKLEESGLAWGQLRPQQQQGQKFEDNMVYWDSLGGGGPEGLGAGGII
ncbi:MAG: hypothetical protein M1814_006340 [Vezdaea aestivalis]|nr:MAG: hypothetical protein M1814_006340 [Vezdaea aestivalis]